mmetsp:Transcript_11052/g.20067  ORF Transcript_11052/g.20067 Transcript_11052/m.20067 type:complete len:196 (+) Transcript_11052:95-682(+)
MTDRFYQIGLDAEEGVFKTSYEVANDMTCHPRSPYPPGYSGHQPGARQKFGYSTPGPDAWRLSNPPRTPPGVDLELTKSCSTPVLSTKIVKPVEVITPKRISRLEATTYSVPPDARFAHRQLKAPLPAKIDTNVTVPYTGAGTGFRTQYRCMAESEWWPSNADKMRSTYNIHFCSPPFHRLSPLKVAGSLSAIAN